MSSNARRSSMPSVSGAAIATMKRPAAAAKVATAASGKKRAALGNLTNQGLAGRNLAKGSESRGINKAALKSSSSTVKKGSINSVRDVGLRRNSLSTSSVVKPTATLTTTTASSKVPFLNTNNVHTKASGVSLVPCSTAISPNRSTDSISLDESMSTCDSMKSPEFEYIDNGHSSAIASLERKACTNFHISDNLDADGHTGKKDAAVPIEIGDDIIDVDNGQEDPQLCATYACDIYNCLRLAETKKRPSTDFMERIQNDINASMRSILIDWLVEVSEEYRLAPETLYLTVNYIDRYLSGNEMNRQRLQLLGVACMLIASKYEEICAPQVEEFCYITDNTYFKEEVVQMEAAVLKYLKYEMSAPTIKCFLRRFIRVAQGCDEVPLLQMEFLASYIGELSLLEYSMLCYPPSLIASSAVFLARFILQPAKHPWNSTLAHYTQYQPSDLCECVKFLHYQFCNNPGNNLPAIREKYSQHKYKFVAKKFCPPSISSEYFQNLNK